jgi:hypothetical protein
MNNKTIYPEFADSVEIYEIARIALANKQMFEHVMDELDINESELDRIEAQIKETLGDRGYHIG